MRKVVLMLILVAMSAPLWGGEALALADRLINVVHGSYMQSALTGGFVGCF